MLKRFATWSLLAALLIPVLAGAQALIPGTDYDELAQVQPFEPLDGKVEVVEIFAYSCHYCAQFQPLVDQWKRKLPADVRFTYVPATYSLDDPLARAFYAAQGKPGLFARTHEALFQAINTDITVPRNASIDELAAFYSGYGVTAPAFAAAMQTPAVDAKLRKARDFALAVELQGTPSLIVNGKYRVKGVSYQDMLRIADQLIALERRARR